MDFIDLSKFNRSKFKISSIDAVRTNISFSMLSDFETFLSICKDKPSIYYSTKFDANKFILIPNVEVVGHGKLDGILSEVLGNYIVEITHGKLRNLNKSDLRVVKIQTILDEHE